LIYFDLPARAGMPPVRIAWHEGGLMPPRPAELEAARNVVDNGILFVGTKGSILGEGWGRPSTHFDYAGPLTEFVLMGNVALRAGKKLDFDWKKMAVSNVPNANQFLRPNYREGRSI
jgi:hypothetical protein